jgi:hypothetical protein
MKTFTRNKLLSLTLAISLFFFVSGIFAQCPVIVNLGKDTTLCQNGSLVLDAGPGITYLWNDGITTRYRIVTNPGTYSVTNWNNCPAPSISRDTIIITSGPEISLELELPVRSLPYFCKGEAVNLVSSVSLPSLVTKYDWSVSTSNTASVSVDTTRTVTLTVTDQYGCKRSKTKTVEFQYPFEKDSIKLVTFDPTEDKHIIIYSRSQSKRTKSYILYNGYTDKDSLTSRSFTSSNLVVDTKSKPHVAPSYYNVRLVDSCLNQSSFKLEKTHKAMFLKVTREKDGKTSLEWDRYIGLSYNFFYIARGTAPGNITVIDSLKHVPLVDRYYFTDNTLPNQVFYYAIFIKTPVAVVVENAGKKAQAGPFVHSLSNLEDNRIHGTGIKDMSYLDANFKTYPNPYHDIANISYEIDNNTDISLKVFNMSGQQIAVLEDGKKEPGRYEVTFSATKYGHPAGIYYIVYNVKGTGVITRMLIEE